MSLEAAEALLEAGNVPVARERIRDALRQDPHDGDALELLYRCALELDEFAEADRIVKRWLSGHPDDWSAHRSRVALMTQWKPRRAKREVRDLLKRFPAEEGECLLLEANRLINVQDGRKAMRMVKRARARGLNGSRVDALERAASYDKDAPGFVVRSARAALRKAPHDPDAHWTLALALFFSGRIFAARRSMREARRLAPAQRRYYNYYIALTWLVLLPNFALAHLAFILLLFFAALPIWIGMFMFLPMLFVVMFVVASAGSVGDALGIPHAAHAVGISMPVWYVMLFVGTRLGRRTQTESVVLKKDY